MVWPTRGGKKAMVGHHHTKRLLLVARCGEMVAMVAMLAHHHTKLLVARCGEMASVAPLRVRPLHQRNTMRDQYLHHNGKTGSLVIWQQQTVLQSMIYMTHMLKGQKINCGLGNPVLVLCKHLK